MTIIRLLLLLAILGITLANGALQLREMSTYYFLGERSPLPGHEIYDPVRPLLKEHKRIYLAVDGTPKERGQKKFGAQYALAPCFVASPGRSDQRGLPDFLSGVPFLTNVEDPAIRKLIDERLRGSARKRNRTVKVHKITNELLLYMLEDGE